MSPRNFEIFSSAVGDKFTSVQSRSGASDRLQIIFDSSRFELLELDEPQEIEGIKINDGNHRSPLIVHLRDRQTDNEMLLAAVHLARRNEELREQQALGLTEWARGKTIPMVTIGDFNFDYSFVTHEGNQSFATMMRGNIWQWVKPQEWVDTNWSGNSQGEGRYPDSMLDFAFVAGKAREWKPVCNVIVRPGDFPDDEKTSDHRPTELILQP